MAEQGSIPQANPQAAYLALKPQIDDAVAQVLSSGRYILDQQVTAFETEFAAFVGVGSAIGVASGTDALELALRGLGVGPGDSVVTVPHTAVATVAAIEQSGARPVFVDIDPRTYTLDPAALEQTLQKRDRFAGSPPKAVVPVHLYGQPADMPAILEIAERHGLAVVEDAAQAHGARLDGRMTGSLGVAAAFSFYPTKNLGALGDAGMVVTADTHLAEAVRSLRQYGWDSTRSSIVAGMNSRLDEVQAAILRVRFEHLEQENRRRVEIAARYDAGLASTGLSLPEVRAGVSHVFHQYVVRCSRRDEIRQFLDAAGIGTAIHYPVPVHLQPAYRNRLGGPGEFPHSERAAREIVSLPIFPQLTDDEVDRVIAAILQWTAGDSAE